jgi:hypothetical protein
MLALLLLVLLRVLLGKVRLLLLRVLWLLLLLVLLQVRWLLSQACQVPAGRQREGERQGR